MPSSIYPQFGGQNQNSNFQNSLGNVLNMVRRSGKSPQEIVNELVSSGQMSKDQFNQLGQMANMILGRKK